MASKNLRSFTTCLKDDFAVDDSTWEFGVPDLPDSAQANASGMVKSISVVSDTQTAKMTLRYNKAEPSRAIDQSRLHRYMQISFEKFRLQPPSSRSGERTTIRPRDTADYKIRLLRTGITLNGVNYRFFGHSNSQLKSATCYLFAGTEEEITAIIEGFGDFGSIKTAAKKAKRIGLLFSAAEVVTKLAPDRCIDIPDIRSGDFIHTDGCGLISRPFARRLVQWADIRFRGQRFTPSVFQIRYRGYKGVLTLEPELPPEHLVHFRDSMRKFKGVADHSFAVVDFARPYAFGYLNDEIILLLSALGIPREVLERKQREHLEFLQSAKSHPLDAFRFLSFINETKLAERVLLDGLPQVSGKIQNLVSNEIGKLTNKRDKPKSRILIPRSRLLFGVCDTKNVLREGECAIRVTMTDGGVAKTITGTEVLVTRNPCLHPGDLRKFRAVQHLELSHLVDCIVFPVSGRRPSADLMSGGDLDGDKFFVCWDPDIIPAIISQPAKYPGAREPVTFSSITYNDRLVYFASYTNASLGRVKNLYLDWARVKGPMSPECQELNYLFSNCVDGNRISVPSHLMNAPDPPPPEAPKFILDYLHEAALAVTEPSIPATECFASDSPEFVEMLLGRDNVAMSEFELCQLTLRWCDKNGSSLLNFLDLFDFNQFSDDQRAWVLGQFPPTDILPSRILNALHDSFILESSELDQFKLGIPGIRWKRIYSSENDRLALFFPNLSRGMELFTRKLIVLQVDDRLSIAMYVPQRSRGREETVVNDSCRLFAFPHSKTPGNNHRRVVPTSTGYRLYHSNAGLQLYQIKRKNTWIFLANPGVNDSSYRTIEDNGNRRRQRQATLDSGENVECIVSVALDKFSREILNHVGRVNRSPVLAAEIYVISNRDVRSLQVLDEWIHYVDTQEVLPLFDNGRKEYRLPSLRDINWNEQSRFIEEIVRRDNFAILSGATVHEFAEALSWLIEHSQGGILRRVYKYLLPTSQGEFNTGGSIERMRSMMQLLDRAPSLALEISKIEYWNSLPEEMSAVFHDSIPNILKAIILCANEMQGLVRDPFRIVVSQARYMSLDLLIEFVEYISLAIELPEVALDLLNGVLEPESSRLCAGSPRVVRYLLQNSIGIALEHIEEANESRTHREDWFQLSMDAKKSHIVARVRIDAQATMRLATNDHVCLKAVQSPENSLKTTPYVMHALVEKSQPGFVAFQQIHPPPPYLEETKWEVTHRGSYVTTRAMFEALRNFVVGSNEYCMVKGPLLCNPAEDEIQSGDQSSFLSRDDLNASQNEAVQALLTSSVTCLWGPPGTGKTHTLAVALEELLLSASQQKILVTAPTHNAVDNILRAFLANMQRRQKPLPSVRKVASDLRRYTCDAMAGKDLNEHPAARKHAQKQVDQARIVFTTSTGASLGLLRGMFFPVVIIDEASQQTEPQALIPLCKGCERAILVGDHVQLRATVRPLARLHDFDISLFERLFNAAELDRFPPGSVRKVMLQTQYRMHASICSFSSREFYNDRLVTAVSDSQRPLPAGFPWPQATSGSFARLVFVQSSHPEDLFGKSKNNKGQVKLARAVCQLLLAAKEEGTNGGKSTTPPSIAVLAPYTACVEALKSELSSSIAVSSIDGFQGREADIVIFVTTRCNLAGEIGFLRDMRRLNVVVTRPKAGLIIIGDETTLTYYKARAEEGEDIDPELEKAKGVWKRLIGSCTDLPSTLFGE